MILKKPLNFGGRLYNVGDDVKGKLPLDMIATLKSKGAFEDFEEVEEAIKLPEGETDPHSLSPSRSVAELEEYLKGVESSEEVSALLEHEKTTSSPRASAIKVLEKRLQELSNE